jgi:acyl-CoA synthetase (NDP forming)/RimJ/RimL family protein N-acetyltransferase
MAAHIRPIRPEDADLMVEFYARVSDESKYYRFFSPMPTLPERDITRFTTVDHINRVAFVLTVGDKMIAVGRYERMPEVTDKVQAEVAFLVEDAHQGRGCGQMLLEHLAQAGRENGIENFVAEVLPDNVKMIQVFRDAGYRLARSFDEGVMSLEFPIDTTATSVAVMADREHRAEAASIELFFKARSVAVVGASRYKDTVGSTLVRNLVLGDFQGRIYVVNPYAESVAGMPAYAAVSDIPDSVDVAIVAVPAEAVAEVVLDCANKGVHGIIVVSAGFAETGEDGRRRQRRLVGLARGYGLRMIGPNALGIINTASGTSLNASLAPTMPPRGRAGFFCQSGALGVAILENVGRRGLGLSTFVSAGNRADVSGNDLLQYWEEDPATEVVLLYLESIGNPRKFSRIARRVSRKKPVIAVKSGRTTQGVPMGHAVRASMTGQATVDAMFRQAGVIQVDTLDEMFDVAQLVAHQPLPRGPRVAVVGNSDALALLASDAAAAAGLDVRPPIALGPDASADDFEFALDRAIDDPEVDAVLAVYIPPINTSGVAVANVLAAVGEQSDKPILSTFLAAEGLPELLRVPDVAGNTAGRGSVPSYQSPESAVRALARVVDYAAWRKEPEGEIPDPIDVKQAEAREVIERVLRESPGGRALHGPEVTEVLECYGIAVWPRVEVALLDEAIEAGDRLGWDVVLKASAEKYRQRPDLAHVWRNISDADEMRDAWGAMSTEIEPQGAGFVVQKNAPGGVPVSLGGVEDALFGPVVSAGVSGPATELLGDRSFRIPPLTVDDAKAMVRELKAAPLLTGYRGSEPVDTDSVADLLLRLAQLKNDLPEMADISLPLVLVSVDGATVLTATGQVTPAADARADWYVRRMNAQAGDTLAT